MGEITAKENWSRERIGKKVKNYWRGKRNVEKKILNWKTERGGGNGKKQMTREENDRKKMKSEKALSRIIVENDHSWIVEWGYRGWGPGSEEEKNY